MMFKLFSLSSDMCAYTKCHVVTVFSSTVRFEEQVSGCTVCLSGRACTKGGCMFRYVPRGVDVVGSRQGGTLWTVVP